MTFPFGWSLATNEKRVPQVLRTGSHVQLADIVGEEPGQELYVEPSWLSFRSLDDFRTDSYAEFSVTNQDPFTVAFCLRTKLHLFRVLPQCYGILHPHESRTFKLYATPSDNWPRNVDEIVNRILKILVENLRVPENVRPTDEAAAALMARTIFQKSKDRNPQQRMYVKLVVVLEREARFPLEMDEGRN